MTVQHQIDGTDERLTEPLSHVLSHPPASWREAVDAWRQTPQAQALVDFVDARIQAGAVVYPAQVLRALELTALPDVRVVILGQDPYHGPGQAHGLAFSVPDGMRPPPSLRNIFVEIQRELHQQRTHANLTAWAQQGVLLLNTSLTVEAGEAASHAGRGWEGLTEQLLRAVASRPKPCAYLLWGSHAQRFQPLIESSVPAGGDSLILKSNHPSPLSARRPPVPFVGNGHFGAVNKYLNTRGGAIDWIS